MLAATAETARRAHVGVLLPDVYRLMGEIHLDAGALDKATTGDIAHRTPPDHGSTGLRDQLAPT